MPGKGYYQWSLMFQRVSTTDATSIERVSALCQDVCTACNGYFDGWESNPSAPETPRSCLNTLLEQRPKGLRWPCLPTRPGLPMSHR